MFILSRESNTISLANFWENEQLNKYNYSPGYQRDSVWSEEKQSFLIDSILKNIPIPPIFLHQIIDDKTGKTKYAVIDGKQRLTSIIRFIKGEIGSVSEDENSPLYDERISGIKFSDLKKEENEDLRRFFWRYSIPIEYVDSSDKAIIDAIFDRLNRNGEPLTGQELRRAGFYGTDLLNTIESIASNSIFWKKRLKNVDIKRMEDREFISEILFYMLEDNYLNSDQSVLELLYSKYSKSNLIIDWHEVRYNFDKYTQVMSDLDLNYSGFKISGVSHLYAIWCLSIYLYENEIDPVLVRIKLNEFYSLLRTEPDSLDDVSQYKNSMSSGTKGRAQRRRRVQSLINYISQ
ncbi:DUF262 domain-containing protein [Photobacterium kishitanii]|uniref:DUF262 domain-containing protein n=1 Tax=Photobacterium kishitanii TaxID=318456 RepID=UPI0005D464C6|nr:DUF262 domain-containing protein [Photobacterium kishitanii]KJG10155.1 hypothetical protein UB40_08875 [Photobacterium kishitanii]PSV06894.1 DUF262 domain-containing protein [Photobacterium kishitanii]PSV78086.1 DUF262 domain-containing protein [Photobacterium kishitanii]